jgi:hypothetical protein
MPLIRWVKYWIRYDAETENGLTQAPPKLALVQKYAPLLSAAAGFSESTYDKG